MTATPAPVVPAAAANPLLEAALHLAALGYRVFPCHSPAPGGGCTCGKRTCGKPGKHPRNRNGCNGATTNPAQIRRWWRKHPDANVAIATAGLMVVDADGPGARAALERRGDLPRTVTAKTSRGWHLIYRDTTGRGRCGTDLLPGLTKPDQVDIRAAGGYIIAAPSLHASGAIYTWAEGLSPADLTPAPAPKWLYELLPDKGGDLPQAEAPAAIPEGTRNDTLTRLAGGLHADGYTPAQMLERLLEVNAAQCRPPLPEAEVLSVVASVTRYPAGASGPQVRVDRGLLRRGLTVGALTLYCTRQAILQVTGKAPRQAALARTLGVTARSVRRWEAELTAAGLEHYERPRRRYVQAPAGLLTDPRVSVAAKVTALHLAACMNKDIAATVGQEALAKMTGRCLRSVADDVAELQANGHLQAQVAPFNAERGKRERCNTYRFVATVALAAVGLAPQKRTQVARRDLTAATKGTQVARVSRPLGGAGGEAVRAVSGVVSERAQQARSERAVSVKAADLRTAIVETPAPAQKSATKPTWRPKARRPLFRPAIPRLSDTIQAEGEKLAAAAGLQAAMVIAMIHRHGLAKVQAELQAISGGRRSRKGIAA